MKMKLLISLLIFAIAAAQQNTNDPASDPFTCSSTKPCKIGCCSKSGFCGLGPDYCSSTNCISSCDQKSDCDPGWGSQWSKQKGCPLNVCCSQYGFCGTTKEFCGSNSVASPSCSGTSTKKRVVGYYEGWSPSRPCQGIYPEQLSYQSYTHLNYAFAFVDPTSFTVAPMSSADLDLMPRLTRLKQFNQGLQVWISIGGWSMNDPDQPTARTFSQLAGSVSAQSAFISSLIQFMQTYGFDGVDLDWEYPVAPERSGSPADFQNYVSFLRNVRNALGSTGHNYGLTITIPSSYWYMQNFDIVAIEPIVDWFNVMTYDLHGTWDSSDPYIGPYVFSHTNLTEIDQTMQLLWRNNINPDKVTIGLGFYGRSYTLANPSCNRPGCAFSAGGTPGVCSQESGTLTYAEIKDIIATQNPTVVFDQASAAKYMTWNSNQWVSYDDKDTLKLKIDYANSRCLGGLMVWAASTDDSLGSAANALNTATGRNTQVLTTVSNSFSGLSQCNWGECNRGCPAGYSAVERSADGGGGAVGSSGIQLTCSNGVSRPYCCPSDDLPSCHWRGSPPMCVDNICQAGEVPITTDLTGAGGQCSINHKTLCCTNPNAPQVTCGFAGPCTNSAMSCPDGQFYLTSTYFGNGNNGCNSLGLGYYTPYCCNSDVYRNCAWSDRGRSFTKWPPVTAGPSNGPLYPALPFHTCVGQCASGQVSVLSDSSLCTQGTRVLLCCDDPTLRQGLDSSDDPLACQLDQGDISHSGQPDDDGHEIEYYDFELDCYVGGVAGSGDSSGPTAEFEKRSEYTLDWVVVSTNGYELDDLPVGNAWTRFFESNSTQELFPRGSRRSSRLCKNRPGSGRKGATAVLFSAAYNTAEDLVKKASKKAFFRKQQACLATALQTTVGSLPAGQVMVAEHVMELQTVKTFLQSTIDGVGPRGKVLTAGALEFDKVFGSSGIFFKSWSNLNFPSGSNLFGGNSPMDSFYNILGTLQDNTNLLVAAEDLNGMKARVWAIAQNPIAATKWTNANVLKRTGNVQLIRDVFIYLNTPEAQAALRASYRSTREVVGTFQTALANAGITYDLKGAFDQYMTTLTTQMGQNIQDWLTNNNYLSNTIANPPGTGLSASVVAQCVTALKQLQATLPTWANVEHGWIGQP